MDEQSHAAHIATIRGWLESRPGRSVTVDVVTPHMSGGGETRVHKVNGPFSALEEHPAHPGVFRAVFDGSRDPEADGAAPWVGLGYEISDVAEKPGLLVATASSGQRVEFRETEAAPARVALSASEVSWDQAAPPPPPPPPPVLPVVSPPAPPSAPPSPSAGSAGVEFRVKAPVYANATQSNFFGDAIVRVEGDLISVTARRSNSNGGGMAMIGGVLLGVLSVFGLGIGLTAAVGSSDPRDTPITIAVLSISALVLAVALILYFIGRSYASRGETRTVTFRKSESKGRKVSYDDNLGCLLSLLLTPAIGLIVMFAMGRRVVRLTAPVGPGGAKRTIILRTRSAADGAMLDRTLRGS